MKPSAFFAQLKEKKVAVIGVGVSHRALIRLFLEKGIAVTVLDKRDAAGLGEDYEILRAAGARFRLGADYLCNLTDFDVVFRTPGMYYNTPALTAAREAGVAVTSEMEVFFDLCPCKLYAVTGSDGKTTTTTLIGKFLEAAGKRVYVGGNIGRALLPLIEEIRPEDVCVVELSSFQLISMRRSPDVAVVTNISPNHLDVHGTMEEYIDAKKNLLLHQNAFSRTVLNADNEPTMALASLVRGRLSTFSRLHPVDRGGFLEDGWLCLSNANGTRRVLPAADLLLPGVHNIENMLTAMAAVDGDVPDEAICQVARTFTGVEHRIELVRTVDGVRYYNDSIASSPTRTVAGLRSFDQKIILIAGGYDKQIPYAPLAEDVCNRVKLLILLGATAPKIEAAVTGHPAFATSGLKILRVSTLEEAVKTARELSVPGDVVSLSPASASFDLYRNFEERGHHFKRLVNEL